MAAYAAQLRLTVRSCFRKRIFWLVLVLPCGAFAYADKGS